MRAGWTFLLLVIRTIRHVIFYYSGSLEAIKTLWSNAKDIPSKYTFRESILVKDVAQNSRNRYSWITKHNKVRKTGLAMEWNGRIEFLQ